MTRLFEIPIYSLDEKQFLQLYNEKRLDCYDIDEDMSNSLKSLYYPKYVWRFNQIVGYIIILFDESSRDICFEVYKPDLKKLRVLSEKKRWFQNLMCLGLHFRCAGLSNEEIRDKIKMFIDEIKAKFFAKRYVDLEQFNNLIGFVDFSKL